MTSQPVIEYGDVQAAALRIADATHRTPVLRSRTLDYFTGAKVHLKCENFQRSGAFKFRGAYNTLAQLPARHLRRGVAAYSTGNHAQAVALAAKELGTTAVVLMPDDEPAHIVAAIRGYGAEIVTYNRHTGDRAAMATAVAAQRGLTLIPPFEDSQIMAGHGTTAIEFLEDAGPLDALVVPMGGGGLMAGCATAAVAMHPTIRMVGVEPQFGNDTRRSLAAGRRVRISSPHTVADGLATPAPGELTFSVNRRLVDEIVEVTDDEIVAAMEFLFERMKLVVEPAGAASVAALLGGQARLAGLRVGAIISGGNIGPNRLSELVAGSVPEQMPGAHLAPAGLH